MDTGIVASRYAKALLLYARQLGLAEQAASQAGPIEAALASVEGLQRTIGDMNGVDLPEKLALLGEAAGGEGLNPCLERFFTLLEENRRMPLARLILKDFLELYYAEEGIVRGTITSVKASPALKAKVEEIMGKQSGRRIVLDEKEDPSLLGGFVLEIGDKRLDASVKHQLDTIRRSFVDNNRRII